MSPSDTPANPTPPPRPPGAAPQDPDKTRLTGSPEWSATPQAGAHPPTTHEPPGSTANSPFGPGHEPPSSGDLPQSLQGRYRLIRVLGSGGFANVYLAHDSVLDQPVAIKVLRLGQASKSDRDRFLMEARIGAKLRHPNIVTVFDIIQSPDGLQMVMEYYPGGTLTERIRARGPLPVRETVDITRQIAQALAYAHRHSVIHRDVKPANVFLAGEGMVKLGDFGIAAHADHHEFTQTGMIIGTPLYMPPEQSSDSRDVDPRTDIYALGLSLYHMLTGRPPRVVDLESIPEPFRRLLRQSTAPERSNRLVSCEQFIAMLDQIPLTATQGRRVVAPGEHGTERELDTPATPTNATATRTGLATFGAAPEAPTSTQGPPTPVPTPIPPPPAPSPAPPAPPVTSPTMVPTSPPTPAANAISAAMQAATGTTQHPERVRLRGWVWAIGIGVIMLAVAAAAFIFGEDFNQGDRGKVVASSQLGTTPGAAVTPAPDREPGVSTQTVGQPNGPVIQALRNRREALLKAATATATPVVTLTPKPTPTPTATPFATPAMTPRPTPGATPPRSLDQEFSQYLQANPGIRSAVEILRERGGAGKPEGMRAFEIRQAQATLLDAIKKAPNDPMLNLIVGNMLQKSGRGKEAADYFEKAVLLDQQAGSPLGLNLEVIRDYLNRTAGGQKMRRRMGM